MATERRTFTVDELVQVGRALEARLVDLDEINRTSLLDNEEWEANQRAILNCRCAARITLLQRQEREKLTKKETKQ